MRKIIFVLFCLISFVSRAQVYQSMPQWGYGPVKRFDIDSSLTIPTTCGSPTLRTTLTKKAAIAFDSCNNRFYQYNPKTLTWTAIGGSSIDTTSLSNRINSKADTSALNLKLNITDTSNQFVNSVTKVNDSTLNIIKGTSNSNLTITGVSYATKLKTQVWNSTGSTISKGSVVYINGRHSSNLSTITLAQANTEANSYSTFALVENDIADNSQGVVIQAGNIGNLNLPTSSYTDGQILYLSPTIAGGYTTSKPLAPYHIVKIGTVTRAHPTQGSIELKIENGWQLDELSDVQIASVPADSTILQFSRVDSLWHDVSINNAIGTKYLKPTDTASLSSRINLKVNISDTASMLSPYQRSATAVKYSDTTSMLTNYAKTNLVNTKLNISDTASMLSPYQRSSSFDWIITLGQQAMGSTIKSVGLGVPSLANVTTTSALTTSQMRLIAVYLPKAATLTGVKWMQTTQGVYTANNENRVGLYTYSAGVLTLVASSTNDGTLWSATTSGTMGSKAFSSTYSASAGLYFIGLLWNSSATTTAPALGTGPNLGAAVNTSDFTNSGRISCYYTTTTLLSSVTLSTTQATIANFGAWVY